MREPYDSPFTLDRDKFMRRLEDISHNAWIIMSYEDTYEDFVKSFCYHHDFDGEKRECVRIFFRELWEVYLMEKNENNTNA